MKINFMPSRVAQEGEKMNLRERLKDKKRIVIKVGSSSLVHEETGALNLTKLEILVREISDIRNMGKEVILVSSGAIAVGVRAASLKIRPEKTEEKQACAAIGQARLMMIYQKLFMEYHQLAAQILMTKNTVMDNLSRHNALNTFRELLHMGAIPIVNEHDTVATYELSDIDGLYTDDPNRNPKAEFIDVVTELDQKLLDMGKESSGSNVGTGGMASKLQAAQLASAAGVDMVIANGEDFHVIHKIMQGRNHGTLFVSNPEKEFYLIDYLEQL